MKFKVEEIINELESKFEKGAGEITLETKFKEDLRADSIDLYQMIMEIEDEKGITIDDEDAVEIKTVQDLVNVLNK